MMVGVRLDIRDADSWTLNSRREWKRDLSQCCNHYPSNESTAIKSTLFSRIFHHLHSFFLFFSKRDTWLLHFFTSLSLSLSRIHFKKNRQHQEKQKENEIFTNTYWSQCISIGSVVVNWNASIFIANAAFKIFIWFTRTMYIYIDIYMSWLSMLPFYFRIESILPLSIFLNAFEHIWTATKAKTAFAMLFNNTTIELKVKLKWNKVNLCVILLWSNHLEMERKKGRDSIRRGIWMDDFLSFILLLHKISKKIKRISSKSSWFSFFRIYMMSKERHVGLPFDLTSNIDESSIYILYIHIHWFQ